MHIAIKVEFASVKIVKVVLIFIETKLHYLL